MRATRTPSTASMRADELAREVRAEDRGGEDGARRHGQARRGVHPRDPRVGGADLGERRQQIGARPHAVEELAAAQRDDRVGEPLPGRVLLHLQVEPGEAHDRALDRVAALAAALEAIVDLGEVRQDPRAGGVHHVVRVALQQRHEGLGLVERLALAGGHDSLDPVALAAGDRLADAAHQPAGLRGELLDRLGHEPREVGPQPGMGLELEGVRRLVERDERAELVARQAHRGGRAHDVRLDEVEPAAGRAGGQQADVVLAEHLAPEEGEHEAELLVADRAVQPARGGASGGVGSLLRARGGHPRRGRTGCGRSRC